MNHLVLTFALLGAGILAISGAVAAPGSQGASPGGQSMAPGPGPGDRPGPRGMPVPEKIRISVIEKACAEDDGKACFFLARACEAGEYAGGSRRKAYEIYEKACALEAPPACTELGSKHDLGTDEVKQDYKRALEFYTPACELNDPKGCALLGLMYDEGKGLDADYEKAREIYEKACALDDGFGCQHLGRIYVRGKGVAKDEKQAFQYFKKGCDLRDRRSCEMLKSMNFQPAEGPASGNYKEAVEYFERGCHDGRGPGCRERGRGPRPDRFRGGRPEHIQDSLKFFEKGCSLNDAESCHNLSRIYLDVLRVEREPEAGEKYLRKACTLGSKPACMEYERFRQRQ